MSKKLNMPKIIRYKPSEIKKRNLHFLGNLKVISTALVLSLSISCATIRSYHKPEKVAFDSYGIDKQEKSVLMDKLRKAFDFIHADERFIIIGEDEEITKIRDFLRNLNGDLIIAVSPMNEKYAFRYKGEDIWLVLDPDFILSKNFLKELLEILNLLSERKLENPLVTFFEKTYISHSNPAFNVKISFYPSNVDEEKRPEILDKVCKALDIISTDKKYAKIREYLENLADPLRISINNMHEPFSLGYPTEEAGVEGYVNLDVDLFTDLGSCSCIDWVIKIIENMANGKLPHIGFTILEEESVSLSNSDVETYFSGLLEQKKLEVQKQNPGR